MERIDVELNALEAALGHASDRAMVQVPAGALRKLLAAYDGGEAISDAEAEAEDAKDARQGIAEAARNLLDAMEQHDDGTWVYETPDEAQKMVRRGRGISEDFRVTLDDLCKEQGE